MVGCMPGLCGNLGMLEAAAAAALVNAAKGFAYGSIGDIVEAVQMGYNGGAGL